MEEPGLPENMKRALVAGLYNQQLKKLFGEKTQDRIVSISKEYIRPIISGKETEGVEFSAKVNKMLVGGIGFIGHLSYDAFNEGTRIGKRHTHAS